MATQPDDGRRAWLGRLLPAATFLVGLVLGALVVGAVAGDVGPSTGDTAESTTSPTPTGSAPETTVVVPGACTDAAEAVRSAVRLLRQGAASVRDFDPDELVRVLNELEIVEPRVRALARQCSDVEVNPSPTPEGS